MMIKISDKVSLLFDIHDNEIIILEEHCSYTFPMGSLINDEFWIDLKKRRYNEKEIFLIEKYIESYIKVLVFA